MIQNPADGKLRAVIHFLLNLKIVDTFYFKFCEVYGKNIASDSAARTYCRLFRDERSTSMTKTELDTRLL